jgi:hypothetical protein
MAGVVALLGYSAWAPDKVLYSEETTAHLFWHDFFSATVSSDPGLYAIYGYNAQMFSDNLSYVAAARDLRGRNDGTSPIATVNDGVLDIDIFKGNGVYDQEIRSLYFRMVGEHPWLVLRSCVIGKPKAQMLYFEVTPPLWQRHTYVRPFLLALAATLLALALGMPPPTVRTALMGTAVAVTVFVCSTLTSFIYPTALIPEVLVTWLMLAMLGGLYLPLVLISGMLRRRLTLAPAS